MQHRHWLKQVRNYRHNNLHQDLHQDLHLAHKDKIQIKILVRHKIIQHSLAPNSKDLHLQVRSLQVVLHKLHKQQMHLLLVPVRSKQAHNKVEEVLVQVSWQ
jgi:hypothetical protein